MNDTLRWFYTSRKALLAWAIALMLAVMVALGKITAEQATTRLEIALVALGFTVAIEDAAKKARVTTAVAPGGSVEVTETAHGGTVVTNRPPPLPPSLEDAPGVARTVPPDFGKWTPPR